VKKSEAGELLKQARTAWEAEEWLRSADLYERLLAHFPDEKASEAWWYDAALAHKFLRNWAKAYELGREAAARAPRGEGDPAYWNLGIAATIQGDWAVARDAWAGFGIELPDGEGPIETRFGPACVRLDTDGQREVVWIERLCPTRGKVVNVPVTGGRRYGEIVVHDGEPKGQRIYGGVEVPVFDELLLLEASELPTLEVTVSAAEADDLEALLALFTEHGFGAEPASGVRVLCACCSEGTHEQKRTVTTGAQQVSLAAPEEEARRLLERWAGETVIGRSWSGLALVG